MLLSESELRLLCNMQQLFEVVHCNDVPMFCCNIIVPLLYCVRLRPLKLAPNQLYETDLSWLVLLHVNASFLKHSWHETIQTDEFKPSSSELFNK